MEGEFHFRLIFISVRLRTNRFSFFLSITDLDFGNFGNGMVSRVMQSFFLVFGSDRTIKSDPIKFGSNPNRIE